MSARPSRKVRWFVALAATLVVAALTIARIQSQDDRYMFGSARSQSHALVLTRTPWGLSFVLTGAELQGVDTLLLGVRVSSSQEQPWVRIRAGGSSIEQHLEPSTRGLRWLNLTALRSVLRGPAKVELEAHGLTLETEGATLRTFRNELDFAGPLLVLAPHPDDAEIGAFALYASHPEHAHIVTVTSGNGGQRTYSDGFAGDNSAQFQFKGYLRAIDSVTVPWQGGVPPERCFNLGYFDSRLAEMRANPKQPIPEFYGPNTDTAFYRRANLSKLLPATTRLNTWQNLVEDLDAVLAALKPSLIALPHPWLDKHPDHRLVSAALVEALAQHPAPVTFLLYTVHATNEEYPLGPAGAATSLPPWSSSELPVQSIYAIPLDEALRRRKLFAMESMHDLRPTPGEQAKCDSGQRAHWDHPRNPQYDYLRRATRSEETFLVMDRAGLVSLVESELASVPPP